MCCFAFMSNQLTKVDGEKFLYFREVDGIRHYYLRKRTETEDTEVALGTTKITMACKLRDWSGSQPNKPKVGHHQAGGGFQAVPGRKGAR